MFFQLTSYGGTLEFVLQLYKYYLYYLNSLYFSWHPMEVHWSYVLQLYKYYLYYLNSLYFSWHPMEAHWSLYYSYINIICIILIHCISVDVLWRDSGVCIVFQLTYSYINIICIILIHCISVDILWRYIGICITVI